MTSTASRLVLPTTVFEERHVLDLDGTEVHLIYVGPCHQIGDTIIHVPKEKVVFAGDVIFRECTPMGWNGSYEKWLKILDLIISLKPDVIVPGHGPVCGIEGAMEMKAYLEYVREESKRCFGQGLSALEASKKIDFGPYGGWRAPARLYMNVERAYRELRNEAADTPWDHAKVFDAVLAVAKAKGIASRVLKGPNSDPADEFTEHHDETDPFFPRRLEAPLRRRRRRPRGRIHDPAAAQRDHRARVERQPRLPGRPAGRASEPHANWRPGARRTWASGPRARSRGCRTCGCTSRSRSWRCSTSA